MKFFLAQHEILDMKYGHMLQNSKGDTIRRVIIPVNIVPADHSEKEEKICENLKDKIAADDEDKQFSSKKQLILSMATIDGTLTGSIGIADGYGNILGALNKTFGEGNVRLEVMVDNFRDLDRASPAKRFNIFSDELNVFYRGNLIGYVSDDAEFRFNDTEIVDKFKMEECSLGGSVTIIASVDYSSLECDICQDRIQMYKKMLQEEICCDAVILAKDKIQVKCHRGILSAQSPVLRAMFQTDMVEGKKGIVEMPDMSEESVRAFLAYLYHWEETCAVKQSSQIAVDLFQAAHKYDVPSLEKSMKKMLLAKPNKWYDPEVALKLFLFARNLPSGTKSQYELKMKATRVMQLNFNTLEKTPSYAKLFKDEPKAAMELCKFAFLKA